MAALLRIIRSVSIGALLFSVIAGLFLVFRASRSQSSAPIEFSSGYGPGVVLLEGRTEVGPDPFTAPIAVDIGLDHTLVAYAPINAEIFVSPHRRASAADRLVAGGLGRELAARTERDERIAISLIESLAADYLGDGGQVLGLGDRNRDGRDDDGRFTLQAADGSAVCVETGPARLLAAALGASVDPEGEVAVGGLSWDPTGPCEGPQVESIGRQVQTGATPGLYGTLQAGEVCDSAALLEHLEAIPAIGEGWALVHGITVESLGRFVSSLTPVVLLRDTLVTSYGWRSGRIVPRQSVLERGTPVLIDLYGVPAVRCLSGSPLQPPVGLPAEPSFQGRGWIGFDRDLVHGVPPADREQSTFLLVDLLDGEVVRRTPGSDGSLGRLAGPLAELEPAADHPRTPSASAAGD